LRVVIAYEGLLNISSLNLEREAEIRKMPVIYWESGGPKFVPEVPAISGVMLKHWHFRNLVELSREDKLCFFCNQLQAIRIPPEKVQRYYGISYRKQGGKEENDTSEKKKDKVPIREIDLINNCVGEDVHGFLVTEKEEALRRESCVLFSWAIGLPRISEEYRRIVVVQHTRNIGSIPSDAPDELRKMQMPYPRPYASDLFGFTSIANLSRIGVSYTDNLQTIDSDVRRRRQRNTILAYAKMVQGEIGANLARSLPASIPITVFLAASKKGMIPAPIHPIYPNYLVESARLFKGITELFKEEYMVRIYAPYISEAVKNEVMNILGNNVTFMDEPYTGFKDTISFLGLEG